MDKKKKKLSLHNKDKKKELDVKINPNLNIIEPNKQDIKKLAQRNLHGVDAAKLEIMSKKFRPPSGEKGKIIYK